MLSSRVRQAVNALAHLARTPDSSHTTDEIAAAIGCAPCTLAKILPQLKAASFVGTQRGIGGGVRLCCDPRCVSAWDVVQAVAAHASPPLAAGASPRQDLERRLAKILATAEQLLRNTTIEDLANAPATGDDADPAEVRTDAAP